MKLGSDASLYPGLGIAASFFFFAGLATVEGPEVGHTSKGVGTFSAADLDQSAQKPDAFRMAWKKCASRVFC